MKIYNNSKGRGLYATKEYQPWDLIYVESTVFSCSSVCNKEYIKISQETKNQHEEGSFINRMLNFISHAPNDRIMKLHPQLKFPVIYLLNNGKLESISHLARASKIKVNDKTIRKIAIEFKINKDDLKSLIYIFQANGFSVPGLFFKEIGIAIFDKGSILNHACDPNALVYITYDKMSIYARKPISIDEEITISYKPLFIPDISSLLDFKCQCGNCDRNSTILKEVYDQFNQIQTVHKRIDYMIDRWNEIPSSERIELLIESYYELWIKNGTYREKELYSVLQKFNSHVPNVTWIDSWFLCLILASNLGLSDHFPNILEKIKLFVNDKNIIEHIVVATTLIPHAYHQNLSNILIQLGLTP